MFKYVCVPQYTTCMPTDQKWSSDPFLWNWSYNYEPPCECWELNLGPLEKQQVLLSIELSLQPQDDISILNSASELLWFLYLYLICLLYISTLGLSSDTPEESIRAHYRWL